MKRCEDILSIKGFHSESVLGIYDWERHALRPVIINLDISICASTAAKSDTISDALDYALLIEKLDQFIRLSRFNLIESLAEHIANFILDNFPCSGVKVEVIKPNIINKVEQISICIERQR
ncbi:MAG: dihydroneopterin aldolase [Gammaproteobacteria bacterium]|nr:dihydroneopterin aldolase [Gammaproteobacteria bacterium]